MNSFFNLPSHVASTNNRFATFSKLVMCVALSAGLGLMVRAGDVDVTKLPPPSSKTGLKFETDIKPIFEKNCTKCHGAEKQKGKLRLDSLESSLKGGEDAPNIVPGKSAKSTLVHSISRIGDEDDFMPPKGKGDPLTKEEVGIIRAWIDQGAK